LVSQLLKCSIGYDGISRIRFDVPAIYDYHNCFTYDRRWQIQFKRLHFSIFRDHGAELGDMAEIFQGKSPLRQMLIHNMEEVDFKPKEMTPLKKESQAS
jgi:hypothetical protein